MPNENSNTEICNRKFLCESKLLALHKHLDGIFKDHILWYYFSLRHEYKFQ